MLFPLLSANCKQGFFQANNSELAFSDGNGNMIQLKTPQSAVCILPLVCSLYLTPCPQFVVYTGLITLYFVEKVKQGKGRREFCLRALIQKFLLQTPPFFTAIQTSCDAVLSVYYLTN